MERTLYDKHRDNHYPVVNNHLVRISHSPNANIQLTPGGHVCEKKAKNESRICWPGEHGTGVTRNLIQARHTLKVQGLDESDWAAIARILYEKTGLQKGAAR
jgi:hypothetical protein